MFRTANAEKMKQVRPKARTVVFTIVWLVLVAGALLFIAFAGHI